MIGLLSLILFILLISVGKMRGLKTFMTFYLSIFLIIVYLLLMTLGLNPVILALIICLIATISTLFLINGFNLKTLSAFLSILGVLVLIFTLIVFVCRKGNLEGFSMESIEDIGGFSYNIGTSMLDVLIGMYLLSIIGTVIDTSLSVASAMNEVLVNNHTLTSFELFKSGMNVGKDILATTINTLYFAIISNFIGFFLWHRGATFEFIINYKVFNQEVAQLLLSFIASIMIIPITSYITSRILLKLPLFKRLKD